MRTWIFWIVVWEACWLACFFVADLNMYVAEKPTPWIKDRASAMQQAIAAVVVASAVVGLGSWCQMRWRARRGLPLKTTRETILVDGQAPALPAAAYVVIAMLLGVAVLNGSIVAAWTAAHSTAYGRSGATLVQEALPSSRFISQLLCGFGTALGSVLAPALILWWSRKPALVRDKPNDPPSSSDG